MKRSFLIIFLLLLCDQALKIWIKTHMYLGQEYNILGNWFIIHFTENNGMAFGLEMEGEFGKLALSLFRVVAISAIGYYLYTLIRDKASAGFISCVSLIFAGAMGNIIDSAFYGVIFSDSVYQVATVFPVEGGYSSFLYGRVVDMFYFPVIEGHYPEWFPWWGSEQFIFFRPVFNLADSSITTGIALIIIFQKRFFKEEEEQQAA